MIAVTALSALVLGATSVLAASPAVSVSYDTVYDSASTSLNEVACSNGPNGLVNKYPTFGSLPNFPYIGGAQAITGYDSPNCGTCWELEYQGTTITVLAIDYTLTGFNINLDAMNELTDGQAEFLGRINATATQVSASNCGL